MRGVIYGAGFANTAGMLLAMYASLTAGGIAESCAWALLTVAHYSLVAYCLHRLEADNA